MSDVGEALKKEREAQEKSRADVARATGILIHQLAALEHGNFDALPDDDTVAGFVKAYAEYLGFVPDQPVAEFWAERRARAAAAPVAPPEPVRATVSEPEATSSTRPARWPWLVAAAAVVLVVLWIGMHGSGNAGRTEEAPAVPAGAEIERADEPAPASEEPAPRPEPEPPAPAPALQTPPAVPAEPPAAASRLTVTEYGVGTGVEGHHLVGASDRFRLGTKVWFWTRVRGGRRGDAIEHVWLHEGRNMGTIRLAVGSADWRTRSVKTMYDGSAGRWTVEARDRAGNVLARSTFVCVR